MDTYLQNVCPFFVAKDNVLLVEVVDPACFVHTSSSFDSGVDTPLDASTVDTFSSFLMNQHCLLSNSLQHKGQVYLLELIF